MKKLRLFLAAAAIATAFQVAPIVRGADAALQAPKAMLDMGEGVAQHMAPSSADVTVARSTDDAAPGVIVTIQPGKDGYPGVNVKPDDGSWDLSNYGHVEAKVTNTGTTGLNIALRVDNAGNWQDNPWNTESVYLKPGETGIVKTMFGYAYGLKPGYKLNPTQVVNLVVFTTKSDVVQSFRIESIMAAGPKGEAPPVDPASIRTKPQNGFLMGGGATLDAATQIATKGAQAALVGSGNQQTLKAVFPAAQGEQSVTLKPAVGRWDLRDYLEVHVGLRNDGQTPVTPRVRVDSNHGATDWVTAAPLAPGAKSEVVVPFISPTTANLSQKGTGNHLGSDSVSAVTIAAQPANGEQDLTIESVKAVMPPMQLPAWLGKRPPVDGDWVKTLDDEFNGAQIDQSVWNVAGENYYDKQSHWSKNNVLLGGGAVKLRYEKKTGFQNDDPTRNQTPYAAGFLDTYGKWTQRYGYFEARMKLPKAPGLWPGFWMMPDRGAAFAPEQWKRADTANGGMEFDIMEHLTRWGGTRYNIAMHYDGYGKDHKSDGSDLIYVQPDKDGYITAGLLWTPGSAIYYCNGKEVLRWEDPRISNVPSDLIFTLPMGGWDNNALDDAQLPADFTIDYVRVWQRKDLASPSDGKQTPPAQVTQTAAQ